MTNYSLKQIVTGEMGVGVNNAAPERCLSPGGDAWPETLYRKDAKGKLPAEKRPVPAGSSIQPLLMLGGIARETGDE